jgi:hypothetical protein
LTLFIPLELLVNAAKAECRNIDVELVTMTLDVSNLSWT